MNPVELVKQDVLECAWDPAVFYLFSAEVEPLVYYSHLFPALAAVVLALVVLIRKGKGLSSRIFILIAGLFALFSVFDLVLWAVSDPSLIMFLWSLLTYIEPVIYALTLYLVVVFVQKRDVSLGSKIAAGILLMPVILLGPTSLNLTGYDYTNCWRLAIEGPLLYYVYAIEIIFVTWIVGSSVFTIRKTEDRDQRRSAIYLTIGALLFLLAFSSGNIFGTLFQGILGEEAWVIGQYGFFGMPVFLAFVMYLVVKFEMFDAHFMYAEALLLTLWVLLLSLLFIPSQTAAQSVIVVTLVLFALVGYFLLRGIKRDIEQRREIEGLAKKLEKANKRLKILDKMKSEFVSIASHQLRSPLTSIRGYASMLLEGSYGKLPQKATEAVERIQDSSRYMALSVEDYLNVSRIEAGNMKYEIAEFNLKEVTEKVVDEVRPAALKKGLLMVFRSDCDGSCSVKADIGKVRQVLHNLIDNAMKYTPKGSITVIAHDDVKKKKMYVSIVDTGVGMSHETIEDMFDKFVRARNANEVNVTGTGLGLFVAKKMIEEMGGRIWAESEGEGKGSKFHVELPLLAGAYR